MLLLERYNILIFLYTKNQSSQSQSHHNGTRDKNKSNLRSNKEKLLGIGGVGGAAGMQE